MTEWPSYGAPTRAGQVTAVRLPGAPAQAYYLGLDLGQQQDHTAIAIAERLEVESGAAERPAAQYHCRHLERLPLGTPYPQVVERLRTLVARPPLRGAVRLAVDATGVGLPVVDMLKAADLGGAPLYPVLITAGAHVTHEHGVYRVPKQTLVAGLQVLLQSGRFKVAPALPEAATLTRELLGFKVRITAQAHETFEAWREGVHDDLVLAATLAVWLGEWHHAHRWQFW